MNKKGIAKQNTIYDRIRSIISSARSKALYAVNTEMVQAYWLIGKEIVEEEQKGKRRAVYGEQLIEMLAKKLTLEFGSGFLARNLWYMRNFYLSFQKLNALRSELTWTHYRLLMRVEDKHARSFYEIECTKDRWSARELERQINSLLFERLALSKDKKGLMKLAKKGQEIQKSEDLVKDPYILEFVGLKGESHLRESNLVGKYIDGEVEKCSLPSPTHAPLGCSRGEGGVRGLISSVLAKSTRFLATLGMTDFPPILIHYPQKNSCGLEKCCG